jgi:hypothetical protein
MREKTMSIEAMKQALEALELAQDNLRPHEDNCFLHDEGEYNRCFCGKDSLSNFLQEQAESLSHAIAEAKKQKPVAFMQDSIELYVKEEKDEKRGYVIPLYTHPYIGQPRRRTHE